LSSGYNAPGCAHAVVQLRTAMRSIKTEPVAWAWIVLINPQQLLQLEQERNNQTARFRRQNSSRN
jgi:hypothetical protein